MLTNLLTTIGEPPCVRGRRRTVSTLVAPRGLPRDVNGMEEVKGSSPLSSTILNMVVTRSLFCWRANRTVSHFSRVPRVLPTSSFSAQGSV